MEYDAIAEEDYLWLTDVFSGVALDDMPDSDAAVSFYVGGYIGRSISRRRKCSSCKDLLVQSNYVPSLIIPEKHKELVQTADRGGLSQPTELCFGITALAVMAYTSVVSEKEMLQKLFCNSNQARVFLFAFRKMVETSLSQKLAHLLNIECAENHDAFNAIFICVFNCCAKNELKRLNSRPLLEEPPAKTYEPFAS